MEIVSIFAVIPSSLYSVKFEGNDSDEFSLAFKNWNDVEFLENYFEHNKIDLLIGDYKNITIEEAIITTIKEAYNFESKIKKVAKNGSFEGKDSLQDLIFSPLKKNDANFTLQESKAYGTGNKSWLRIYAIRISPTMFVVSGSAIKLRDTMSDSKVTQNELLKLKATAKYLIDEGYTTEEDLGYLDLQI